MMKNICLALIISFLGLAHSVHANNRIVAVVDDDVITQNDLQFKYKVMLEANRIPVNTAEDEQNLKNEVLNLLINERVFLQEAKNLKIDATPAEIDRTIAKLAAEKNVSSAEFIHAFKAQGVPEKELRSQMRNSMIWDKILSQVIAPKISISQAEITDFLNKNYPEKINIHGFVIEVGPLEMSQRNIDKLSNCSNLPKELENLKLPFEEITSELGLIKDAKVGNTFNQLSNDSYKLIDNNNKKYMLTLCEKKFDVDPGNLKNLENQLKAQRVAVQAENYMQNLKKKKFIQIYNSK